MLSNKTRLGLLLSLNLQLFLHAFHINKDILKLNHLHQLCLQLSQLEAAV